MDANSSQGIPGPILVVGLILLIAFCLLWAAPLIMTLLTTRTGAKPGARLDREDRTTAMVFCYTLAPEAVQRIRLLHTLGEKVEALEAEYLSQNPSAIDAEAKGIVKSYLELYGAEVGEGEGRRPLTKISLTGASDASADAHPDSNEEKEASE